MEDTYEAYYYYMISKWLACKLGTISHCMPNNPVRNQSCAEVRGWLWVSVMHWHACCWMCGWDMIRLVTMVCVGHEWLINGRIKQCKWMYRSERVWVVSGWESLRCDSAVGCHWASTSFQRVRLSERERIWQKETRKVSTWCQCVCAPTMRAREQIWVKECHAAAKWLRVCLGYDPSEFPYTTYIARALAPISLFERRHCFGDTSNLGLGVIRCQEERSAKMENAGENECK